MEKFKNLFAESRARTLLVIGVLVVALAVPITVRLVGEQQDLRQRADSGASHPANRPQCVTQWDGYCPSSSSCKSGYKQQYGGGCGITGPQDICCVPTSNNEEKECETDGACVNSHGPNYHCSYAPDWKCEKDAGTCDDSSECSSGEICNSFNRCVADSSSNEDDNPSSGGACDSSSGRPNSCICTQHSQCASNYCGTGMCKNKPDDTTQDNHARPPDNSSNPGRGGNPGSGRPGSGDNNSGDTEDSSDDEDDNQPSGPLACGAGCSNVNACAGAPNGCTTCSGIPLLGGTVLFGTCKPAGGGATPTVTTTVSPSPSTTVTVSPTASVTPTTTPVAGACGTRCTDDSACGGAGDGCGTCAFVGQTRRMTCQRNGITPTPSAGPNDVSLTLNLQMPGIGQNTGDNQNPNNPNRTTHVIIYNSNNEEVGNTSGTSQFDGTDTYTATLSSSQVPSGIYYLKASFDNTLMTRVPGVVQLTQGQVTNTPLTTLVPGDMNGDNILDVRDYNMFIPCYGGGSQACQAQSLADFNDDGQVGGVDYNILLRSFAIRVGD